jgi:hypothetical protein
MRIVHAVLLAAAALFTFNEGVALAQDDAPKPAAAEAPKEAPKAAPAAADAAPKHDEKDKGAKADEESDPNDHTPSKFTLGVNLQRLSKFDLGLGSYEADFLVSIRCDASPCKPQLHLYNGDMKGKPEVIVDEAKHKVYRVKAELSAFVDVSEFPFDEHVLEIDIGDRDALDVTFVADAKETPAPSDVKIAGWEVTSGVAKVESEDLGGGLKDQHVVYELTVKRPTIAAFCKNFLPPLTMVLVLIVSLFMKPKMAPARLAAGTGSFVAVIMFHNTAVGQLPPLGSLTRMDKFMFTLYLLWLIHIAFSIAILRSDEAKNEARGASLYKMAWFVVPSVAILSWAIVFSKIV